MLRALKFVKVPGFRIYKQSIPRINSGCSASPSACRPEPGSNSPGFDETPDPAHLQIKLSGSRYCALVIIERNPLGRPAYFVGFIAYAEIERFKALMGCLIDEIIQQQMPRTVTRIGGVVSGEDIMEAAPADESEMCRYDSMVDQKRRQMTDFSELLRACDLTIEVGDAGRPQKVGSICLPILSPLQLE